MNLRDLDDEQVAAELLQGSKEALEELYDRYGRAVYSLTLHLTSHAAVAEEITQEVFLRAWLKRDGFKSARGSIKGWLLSIAHHRAVDELRRLGRQPGHPLSIDELPSMPDTGEEDLSEGVGRTLDYRRVHYALECLPAEQREVLVLAYFHGLTQREVADHLKQPLGTVKTRTRLALKKLQGLLSEEGGPHDR